MTRKATLRLASLGVALMAVVIGTAGATLAATSTLSAKGNMVVRIARENTTTGSVTANSTTYVDIPGASLTVNAPSTTNGSVLIARFQGHFSVIQAPACIVRIIVNDATVMQPDGNYAIVGQYNVAESVAMSGEIERSLAVNQGTYTVKAQVRLSQASNVNSACIVGAWHFILERMNS